MSFNTTRFLIRGYYGEREHGPHAQSVTMEAAKKGIKARGGLSGCAFYGDGDATRVMLNHSTVYPPARNDKAKWTRSEGDAEDFEALPAIALLGQGAGLLYKGIGRSQFTENAAEIAKGAAHSARFLLPKPDDEYPVFYYRWGNGDARWSFEVLKGNARVVRLLPTWTEANEALFWILKAVEEPTPEQSALIESMEPLLYADAQSVEIDSGQEWYGAGHEVSFLPGNPGMFTVQVEGGRNPTDVENSAHKTLMEQRDPTDDRPLPCWPLSQATVGCNSGAYGWSVGNVATNAPGKVRFGQFPAKQGISAGDIAVTPRGTLNGGTMTGYVEEINEAIWEMIVEIESDGTSSPALSSVSCFAQAGVRIGTDDVTLDTDEHMDKTWIMDIRPTLEKEGRRTTAEVDLFMMNGALSVHSESGASIYPGLTPDGMYNFMQSRLSDVIVNGSNLIKKGRITASTPTKVRGTDLQAMAGAWGNPDSHHLFTVADGWDMVDGFLIPCSIVGDRMYLGAWLRLLLGLRGYPASEMAGISPTMEPLLPSGRGDGAAAVYVEAGDDLGDKLRDALELYGHGRILSCRNGVWAAGFPSTEIKATFQRGDSITYADKANGLYFIFDELDLPNDYGDSYNVFKVRGGKDRFGRPIIKTWKIVESISDPSSPYYIGYEKPYPTKDAPGLRTEAQVANAVMSLAASKGKPGKFMQWQSWWISGFWPGDRYEPAAGQVWELDRICDASTADDRMTMIGRRVYTPAAGRPY